MRRAWWAQGNFWVESTPSLVKKLTRGMCGFGAAGSIEIWAHGSMTPKRASAWLRASVDSVYFLFISTDIRHRCCSDYVA